jgi:hypothetical protein
MGLYKDGGGICRDACAARIPTDTPVLLLKNVIAVYKFHFWRNFQVASDHLEVGLYHQDDKLEKINPY